MEILYHDIMTSSGQPADVVISALQKFIRRGQTENAAWAAYELYLTGEGDAQLEAALELLKQ